MNTLAPDPTRELFSVEDEERIEALELILEAERRALLDADYVSLGELVQRKQALLEQMHPQLNQLRHMQSAAPDDPRWLRIQSRIERNRRINLQNGRLIAQAERHVRDALAVLRGEVPEAYDARGKRGGTAAIRRPLGQA